MTKYKLTWRDLTWRDLKIYLFSLFKAFIPKTKISNLDELEDFIQSKSAWVTQVTLYGYLKTRMGTRYVLHFENDKFMGSVNSAKWNIYAVAIQDLTFFAFSYLRTNFNYQDMNKAKEIFLKILDDETINKMPLDIIEEAVIKSNKIGAEVRPTENIQFFSSCHLIPLNKARIKAIAAPAPAPSVGVNHPSQMPPRTETITVIKPIALVQREKLLISS